MGVCDIQFIQIDRKEQRESKSRRKFNNSPFQPSNDNKLLKDSVKSGNCDTNNYNIINNKLNIQEADININTNLNFKVNRSNITVNKSYCKISYNSKILTNDKSKEKSKQKKNTQNPLPHNNNLRGDSRKNLKQNPKKLNNSRNKVSSKETSSNHKTGNKFPQNTVYYLQKVQGMGFAIKKSLKNNIISSKGIKLSNYPGKNNLVEKPSPKKKTLTKNITLNNSNTNYTNSKEEDFDFHKSYNDIMKNSATKKSYQMKKFIKNSISINLNKSKTKENEQLKLFILNTENYENNYTLYVIDSHDDCNTNLKLKNKSQYYSKEKDFNEIIDKKSNNIFKIVSDLLKLKPRNWYGEVINISNLINNNKTELNQYYNQIIEKYISLNEHFNWIIYSLSYYFKYLFNKNQKEFFINHFNEESQITNFDINDWYYGFQWKGLYMRAIPYNKSKIIINEIKALNYFFFDYLQIIENNQYNNIQINDLLSSKIVFPLIGYTKINNLVLYVSALITLDSNDEINKNINYYINIIDRINQSNNLINFYSNLKDTIDINDSNSMCSKDSFYTKEKNNMTNYNLYSSLGNIFRLDDLLQSRLFSEINFFNLIKIKGGKYLLFNVWKLIPKLFEIKYNHILKFNFYAGNINKENKYFTLNYNMTKNKNINSAQNKYISNPKDVLEKIYKIHYCSNLKFKDVIIGNIFFRILYEKTEITKKENSEKKFYDLLFNYSDNMISCDSKKYIKGNYVILYDLIEPIKLYYSLIKSHKNKGNPSEIINNLFYLRTNYIMYFNSWCDMMNKNSFNIKTYSDLKYNLRKYGINSKLLIFSLINIDNHEIIDIIKIHFLIKVIKKIYDNETEDSKLQDNIFLYIKSFLYPNELNSNEQKYLIDFYTKILFYTNVLFLNYKLIDDYLSLGLINIKTENHKNIKEYIKNVSQKIPGFESPNEFLKHIITICRKKPFLFLTELEHKLNIIINPYIKFKSSLSLESMSKQLEKIHITLNNNYVFSFIKPEEISGLILAKIIKFYDSSKTETILNKSIEFSRSYDSNDTNIDNSEHIFEIKPNVMSTRTNIIGKIGMNNINVNRPISKITKKNFLKDKEQKNSLGKITKIELTKQIMKNVDKDLKNEKMIDNKDINLEINWEDLSSKFYVDLPEICYKLVFNYENKMKDNKYNTSSKKLNDIFKNLYYNLKIKYNIHNKKIIKDWNECNLNIFRKIRTCNGSAEYSLLKSFIFLFIYLYFVTKEFDEAKKIYFELKSIYKNGIYKLSLNELSVINLIAGLCTFKYVESEESYSKSILLLLLNYGEPRGRNNDSHGVLQFPLWEISRKTLKLEQPFIYEYFKEMYETLDYFEEKKSSLNFKRSEKTNINFLNNIYGNIDKIISMNKIYGIDETSLLYKSAGNIPYYMENFLDEKQDFSFLNKPITDKDLSLNKTIFSKNIILDKLAIKHFNFQSISSNSNDINNQFFKEEFIVYFFKQIQSLFLSRHILFDEEYINDKISPEIFIPDILDDFFTASTTSNNASQNIIFSNNEIQSSNETLNNKNNEKIISDFSKMNKSNNIIYKNELKENNFERKTITSNKINESTNTNKTKTTNIFSHFLYIELLQKLSYRKNIPSGIVISFGNNTHNETSHEHYEKIRLPKVIFKLKNETINHIYSGWEHNMVLTNKNEVFSFGHNHKYQCGTLNIDDKDNIKNPTNISIQHNIFCISVSCGNEHSLLLSKENKVYGFGNNEDGVLCLNDKNSKTFIPKLITFGDYTNKIKNISCGTAHNLALTTDGKIFAWGSSQGGQLGIPENLLLNMPNFAENYYISQPLIIPNLSNNGINIIKISCGEAHSIALSDKGEVYSWGFGSNGQLGLGFCEDCFEPGVGSIKSRSFIPHKIISAEMENVKDIQCGKTYTMFINNNEELFACGNNDLNQLGIKNNNEDRKLKCNDVVFPKNVNFPNFKVKKVACGEAHCLAIIDDLFCNFQNVLSWGNNKFGQLGHGKPIVISLPKPITLLNEYNTTKFDEISCGGFHSLCLIKHKEDLSWIDDDEIFIFNIIDKFEI